MVISLSKLFAGRPQCKRHSYARHLRRHSQGTSVQTRPQGMDERLYDLHVQATAFKSEDRPTMATLEYALKEMRT